MQHVQDKVVIITGASSGIGAAAARLLAAQGCKLVLVARTQEKLEALAQVLPTEALPVEVDVTRGEDCTAMAAKTLERFGRIDALLANAGIYQAGELHEGDPETWAQLLDTNVNGVLRAIYAVLPQMRAQGRGDIILTSSISGVEDIVWEPVYSASKHAVQGLAHTLRRQLARSGVRVGAVCPGRVANALWGVTEEAEIQARVGKHDSLRSEDVAEAILFMLTRPPHVTVRDLVLLPQLQDI